MGSVCSVIARLLRDVFISPDIHNNERATLVRAVRARVLTTSQKKVHLGAQLREEKSPEVYLFSDASRREFTHVGMGEMCRRP